MYIDYYTSNDWGTIWKYTVISCISVENNRTHTHGLIIYIRPVSRWEFMNCRRMNRRRIPIWWRGNSKRTISEAREKERKREKGCVPFRVHRMRAGRPLRSRNPHPMNIVTIRCGQDNDIMHAKSSNRSPNWHNIRDVAHMHVHFIEKTWRYTCPQIKRRRCSLVT